MSQYPYGYSPQYNFYPYYPATPQQLLAPAKWAGWIMIALGVILMLFGTCSGVRTYSLTDQEIVEQMKQMPEQEEQFKMSPAATRVAQVVMASLIGIYGLVVILLGSLVRRGGLATIIISIGSMVLPLLLLILLLIGSIFFGPMMFAAMFLVAALPIILLGAATIFLIKAAANSGKIEESKRQMAMMHQQQMQQYYAYQQQGPPTQNS